MKANESKRLKELESEKGRLKTIVADLIIDVDLFKEIAREKF